MVVLCLHMVVDDRLLLTHFLQLLIFYSLVLFLLGLDHFFDLLLRGQLFGFLQVDVFELRPLVDIHLVFKGLLGLRVFLSLFGVDVYEDVHGLVEFVHIFGSHLDELVHHILIQLEADFLLFPHQLLNGLPELYHVNELEGIHSSVFDHLLELVDVYVLLEDFKYRDSLLHSLFGRNDFLLLFLFRWGFGLLLVLFIIQVVIFIFRLLLLVLVFIIILLFLLLLLLHLLHHCFLLLRGILLFGGLRFDFSRELHFLGIIFRLGNRGVLRRFFLQKLIVFRLLIVVALLELAVIIEVLSTDVKGMFRELELVALLEFLFLQLWLHLLGQILALGLKLRFVFLEEVLIHAEVAIVEGLSVVCCVFRSADVGGVICFRLDHTILVFLGFGIEIAHVFEAVFGLEFAVPIVI